MPNTYQIGRVGRIYAAKEAQYGTAPVFAATDAVRALATRLAYNPRNRVDSPERWAHPSLLQKFTRKTTAEFSVGGLFYPSGVLNTEPDHGDFLECGFGTKTNTTLATDVSAAPTATGATVTDAAGLAAGQGVLVSIAAGPSAGKYVRMLTSVVGNVLEWAPALPAAPVIGDAVKGCLTYSLATELPSSMAIARYLTSVNYEIHGGVVDQLKFTIDANDEIRWEASGPAQERIKPAQAEPGAFTTVGTIVPSGLQATLRVGASAYEMLKLEITLSNAMDVDNFPAGISKAQGFFRRGKRSVKPVINAMFSNDLTLLDAGENTTDQVLLAQSGQTEGSIVAFYAPAVEFDVPDDPDSDETMELASSGTAKGVNGNDELALICA